MKRDFEKVDSALRLAIAILFVLLAGLFLGRDAETRRHACAVAREAAHTEADSLRVVLAGCHPIEEDD